MHTYIASSRDVCYHMYIHFEIHTYIMYKRTYTVTLDIECWDDLKLDSIDWAKRVGLFPDEYIHSSVQELTSPRPVDSIWGVTIWRSTGESLHPVSTGILTEDYRYYFRARWVTKVFYQSYPRLLFLLYTHYSNSSSRMGNQCATFLSVYYWLFFGVNGV